MMMVHTTRMIVLFLQGRIELSELEFVITNTRAP